LKIFVLLLVKIWSDILLVKEVQISIWGFQMINLQSIHFIYMNNRACFTWENIAYQSRLPVFDQKRFDWACNIGFGYWLLATKKKDICRLKRSLKDLISRLGITSACFQTFLSFELICKMVHRAPQYRVWALSLCFLYLVSSIMILVIFYGMLKSFGSFGLFHNLTLFEPF
jgi:hypothetical protein